MKKTSFLVLIATLMVFNTSKAFDITIQGCSEPLEVIKFTQDERYSIVLSRDNRIFLSQDQIYWFDALREGTSKNINDVEIISDKLIIAVGEDGLAMRTTDGGENWNEITGLPSVNFTKVKLIDRFIFLLGKRGSILRSNNMGQSFENFSFQTPGSFTDIVFKGESNGFMISDSLPGMWTTTNSGVNWVGRDLPQDAIGLSMAIDGNYLFVAGMGNMENPDLDPMLFIINSSVLSDWLVVPLTTSFFPAGVDMKNGKGAVIMNKAIGEVWTTNSGGMSWQSSFSDRQFYSIAMKGDTAYIASDSGKIVRMTLSLVGISPINTEIPSGFKLSQNYPNPFNPSTKINFSISEPGEVRLAVYNTAGKEVVVLIDQSLSVGNYTADFDASNLTSGVYFYTLQSKGFKDSKRMVLIK